MLYLKIYNGLDGYSRYTVPQREWLIQEWSFTETKERKGKLEYEIYLATAVLGRPAALRRLSHIIPRLVMHGDVLEDLQLSVLRERQFRHKRDKEGQYTSMYVEKENEAITSIFAASIMITKLMARDHLI